MFPEDTTIYHFFFFSYWHIRNWNVSLQIGLPVFMMAMADSTSFPHCFASNWWRAPKCSFRAPVTTVPPRNLWHFACGEHAVLQRYQLSVLTASLPCSRMSGPRSASESKQKQGKTLVSSIQWFRETTSIKIQVGWTWISFRCILTSQRTVNTKGQARGLANGPGLPYSSKNPDNLAMSLTLGSGSTESAAPHFIPVVFL